ncbi:MAG: hypothetical protein AAFR76_14780 [Planctomycetota bacterium]
MYQIAGGEPHDAFGHDIEFLGDVDNDGVVDFAVALPGLGYGWRDRVGEVRAYSGATGEVLYTIGGESGDRFGFRISLQSNHQVFGADTLLVTGMAIDLSGRPVLREHTYVASNGDLVYRETIDIPGVPAIIRQPARAWGDVNLDSQTNSQDFSTLVTAVTSGATPDAGDLNNDDAVDVTDVQVLGDALSVPTPVDGAPRTPGELTAVELAVLRTVMAEWMYLYPDDAVNRTFWNREHLGRGVADWWYDGLFRTHGDLLSNGWLLLDTGLCVDSSGSQGSGTQQASARATLAE